MEEEPSYIDVVANNLRLIISPVEQNRQQSLDFYTQQRQSDPVQYFRTLFQIASTGAPEDTATTQSFVIIHKMLFPTGENILSFVKTFWSSVSDVTEDLLVLCKEKINNGVGIVSNYGSDIFVDVYRLALDYDFGEDLNIFSQCIINRVGNVDLMIETIIKLCKEERPMKYAWIAELANFTKDFIEKTTDEKYRFIFFKLIDAIFSHDFQDMNDPGNIQVFYTYLSNFIKSLDDENDIEFIYDSFIRLFKRTYNTQCFLPQQIGDFILEGLRSPNSDVQINALKAWINIFDFECNICRKNKEKNRYDSILDEFFEKGPSSYKTKYHYPLNETAYLGFNQQLANSFLENIFNLICTSSKDVVIYYATLLNAVLNSGSKEALNTTERFLGREISELTEEEIFKNLVVLLALSRVDNRALIFRLKTLLGSKITLLFETVATSADYMNKELSLRILAYMYPSYFAKEISTIEEQYFIQAITDIYNLVIDSPSLCILVTKVINNYLVFQNSRGKEISKIELLSNLIFEMASQLKDRDNSIELGVFQAACVMEETFVNLSRDFHANEEMNNLISEKIFENLRIYTEMQGPVEGMNEVEKSTRASYALDFIKMTYDPTLYQITAELTDNLIDKINRFGPEAALIEILTVSAKLLFKRLRPERFEKLVAIKDAAISSGIPEVVTMGYKLLSTLLTIYTDELSQELDGYLDQINEIFTSESYMIKSYLPIVEVVCNITDRFGSYYRENLPEELTEKILEFYHRFESYEYTKDNKEESAKIITLIFNTFQSLSQMYPGGPYFFMRRERKMILFYAQKVLDNELFSKDLLKKFFDFIVRYKNNLPPCLLNKTIIDLLIMYKVKYYDAGEKVSEFLNPIFKPVTFVEKRLTEKEKLEISRAIPEPELINMIERRNRHYLEGEEKEGYEVEERTDFYEPKRHGDFDRKGPSNQKREKIREQLMKKFRNKAPFLDGVSEELKESVNEIINSLPPQIKRNVIRRLRNLSGEPLVTEIQRLLGSTPEDINKEFSGPFRRPELRIDEEQDD